MDRQSSKPIIPSDISSLPLLSPHRPTRKKVAISPPALRRRPSKYLKTIDHVIRAASGVQQTVKERKSIEKYMSKLNSAYNDNLRE